MSTTIGTTPMAERWFVRVGTKQHEIFGSRVAAFDFVADRMDAVIARYMDERKFSAVIGLEDEKKALLVMADDDQKFYQYDIDDTLYTMQQC